MLTKAEFLTLVDRESAVIAHLVGRLQPQHLGFRFTPPQRSTQELIEHLGTLLVGSVSYYLSGSWDAWGENAKVAAGITPERFPALIAAQAAEVRRLITAIPDAEFASRPSKSSNGVAMPLPQALLTGTVAWIYSYKMQLFLQAKAAGLADLGGSDLWEGVERKAKA